MTTVRILSFAAITIAVACDSERDPIQPPPPPHEKAIEPDEEKNRPPPSPVDSPPTAGPAVENDDSPTTVTPMPVGGQHVVTFNADDPGGPSSGFEAIIGDWYVGEHEGERGLWVDGTKWRQGTPSASLADQAKKLYGEHYAEFLDNVKAFAFYPVAVWTGTVPDGDIRISVRFYPELGRIDQAAGIVWSLTSQGKYWGVRANPLEDNILYFDVKRGKRKVRATVRGVSTPTRQWHTFVATLANGEVVVTLDGEERFRTELSEPVSGRVGLWSKADSKVLFDDFKVERYPGNQDDLNP